MNRVKLFKAYQKVYRYIENIRGANFLYRNLESMARKQVPEIEEDKTLSISEFEWSNLILLDACRYDVYREVVVRDVDFRITEGSHSEDFISSNFGEDEDWSDVVVVTANPHYENNIAEGGGIPRFVR